MQRKWAVRPDQGEYLSREALITALIDGATMLDLAGGCLEVVVGRAPTNVPGEMVMTGAVLCWKDRTDAKPQAEAAVNVVAAPEPTTPITADVEEPEEMTDETEFLEDSNIDPSDGFDYSNMPEEDVEPAASRA